MAESIVDDDLWNEFHELVNMSSAELRQWLATEDAGEQSEGYPDQAGSPTGQAVADILGKRRTDLTEDDVETMDRVVQVIRSMRGDEPEPTAGDADWRHQLMSIGHDPLKEV